MNPGDVLILDDVADREPIAQRRYDERASGGLIRAISLGIADVTGCRPLDVPVNEVVDADALDRLFLPGTQGGMLFLWLRGIAVVVDGYASTVRFYETDRR